MAQQVGRVGDGEDGWLVSARDAMAGLQSLLHGDTKTTKFLGYLQKRTVLGFQGALNCIGKKPDNWLCWTESSGMNALHLWAAGSHSGGKPTWPNEAQERTILSDLWSFFKRNDVEKVVNVIGTKHGQTALHYAIGWGSLVAVELLLSLSMTDVNVLSTTDRNTPFMHGLPGFSTQTKKVQRKIRDCLLYMLEHRVIEMDFNVKNKDGRNIGALIRDAGDSEHARQLQRIWSKTCEWLKHTYLPILSSALEQIAKIPSVIATLTLAYLPTPT